MADVPNIRKIDFAKFQEDLDKAAKGIPGVARGAPMPGAPRKTADSALDKYDMALRALEALREVVEKDVRGLEASLAKREGDMQEILETIEKIRDESNHIRAQIDRADAVSAAVRDAVAQLLKQIA